MNTHTKTSLFWHTDWTRVLNEVLNLRSCVPHWVFCDRVCPVPFRLSCMLHFGQNVVHKVPAASKVTSVALGQDVKANSFRALGANLTHPYSSLQWRKLICFAFCPGDVPFKFEFFRVNFAVFVFMALFQRMENNYSSHSYWYHVASEKGWRWWRWWRLLIAGFFLNPSHCNHDLWIIWIIMSLGVFFHFYLEILLIMESRKK